MNTEMRKQRALQLSRRNFLRGTGAVMALPFLESLSPFGASAAAKGARPPLRMGIFSTGGAGGTVHESWIPSYTGQLKELPSIMRSLEPFREDILVLSGLSHNGKYDDLNGHESSRYLHLTGAPYAANKNGLIVNSISVDQRAAQLTEASSIFPSIEMGKGYSFRDGGTPVPVEKDPYLIYQRMFKGRQPVVPNWEQRAQLAGKIDPRQVVENRSAERSVVDIILGEAKNLNKRLGRADQKKMDEFLYSVRSLERRIEALEERMAIEAMDASNPGPSELNKPDHLPGPKEFEEWYSRVGNDPEVNAEYIDTLSDLMVLAFQTDTTRVATMSTGGGQWPGVVTVGNELYGHTLQHNGNGSGPDPVAREGLRQIHAWETALFAKTIEKMKRIDEGGSTLFDNSILLYTSYMAHGGHSKKDYPVVLTGGAQGTLKTGRHIAYAKDTPVSNLYVEMLERMGDTKGEFGESATSPKAQYNGRLPDLV